MLTLFFLIPLILLILVILFVGIGCWVASEGFLRVGEDRYKITMHIIAVTEDTITLPRRTETAFDGTFGITWQNNYAVLGTIVANDEQTVTRQIITTTQPLSADMLVTWNIAVYQGNPANTLNLAYTDVDIPSELGPMPAWFLPGKRTTWLILVHGFHGTRETGLPVLPALTQMGFPILVQMYRNDTGAPLSPDNFYHFGDTEWQDVEAGVLYALAHGAQDVVLYGWSMGGCIVETFMHRSSYTSHVRALILDSPLLCWHDAIKTQIVALHLPFWFTYVIEWFVRLRSGTNLATLNYVHPTRTFTTPVLLFHGTADISIPIASSDLYAQSYPDLITYKRINGADHTQAWNVASHIHEEALKTFLTQISTPVSPDYR